MWVVRDLSDKEPDVPFLDTETACWHIVSKQLSILRFTVVHVLDSFWQKKVHDEDQQERK